MLHYDSPVSASDIPWPPKARHGAVLALALIVAWLVPACTPRVPAADPGGNVRDSRVDMRVINNNFNDATLWALLPGRRQFLGRLTGKTETTYTFSVPLSQTVAIEISLLAGGTCVTDELVVDPGDELFLSIEASFEEMGICR